MRSTLFFFIFIFFAINGYIIGQVTQLTNQLLYRSLLIDYVLSSVTYWIMNIHNENVHCCLLVILDLYFVHTSYQMSSRWRKKVYWLLFSNNFKMASPVFWKKHVDEIPSEIKLILTLSICVFLPTVILITDYLPVWNVWLGLVSQAYQKLH